MGLVALYIHASLGSLGLSWIPMCLGQTWAQIGGSDSGGSGNSSHRRVEGFYRKAALGPQEGAPLVPLEPILATSVQVTLGLSSWTGIAGLQAANFVSKLPYIIKG